MKHRLMNRTLFFLACLLAFAGFAIAQQAKELTTEEERRASFQKVFEHLVPVRLYGEVQDQYGEGVAGAEVKIGWARATGLVGKPDPGQTSWVTTGADGTWQFTVSKPWRAFVTEVRKKDYVYDRHQNPAKDLIENPTAPETPFVSLVRKQGETTFLIVNPSGNRLNNPLIRVFSPQSQTNSLDLLAKKGDRSKGGGYADLQVAVNYDNAEGKWTVTYSATNGTDGIIVGNDLLYEAPEDGYQKEVVLKGPPWPRYLYVRSRTPTIYSRLDLEHSTWKESETQQGFRISYKSWVNPYGSRNLEYETDLDQEWRLADRLKAEAKTAHRQGKRPEKPDLKALIKAEKEKKK